MNVARKDGYCHIHHPDYRRNNREAVILDAIRKKLDPRIASCYLCDTCIEIRHLIEAHDKEGN